MRERPYPVSFGMLRLLSQVRWEVSKALSPEKEKCLVRRSETNDASWTLGSPCVIVQAQSKGPLGGLPVLVPKEKEDKNPTRVSLTITAGIIRDGTPGISLSIGEKLIGEWTDSRASTLCLMDNFKVAICGARGERLYLFGVPGREVSGNQVSDTEVIITFQMEPSSHPSPPLSLSEA